MTAKPARLSRATINKMTLSELTQKLSEYQQLLTELVKDNSGLLLPAVSNEPDALTAETLFEQARRLMADKAYYQAALLLYKAAIQGHSRSQCHLGLLYLKGLGIPRSAHHACSWLYLAAQQQEKAAIAAYAALQKKLTSQQLTAARRQAARYFEQIAASPNNSEQDYA